MAGAGIRADRAGTLEVRRVARACIGAAHRMLSTGELTADAVHGARKEIKKSRAAVRLLREALGAPRYRRENERLRNAARALNAVRDARVLVRTLDSLRARDPTLREDPAIDQLSRRLLVLQREKQRLFGRPAMLSVARRTLQQTRFSATQWPVGHHGWGKLGPAFRRIYGAGREAAQQSRSRADDDDLLHEWRKQVKYLWHALQVFQPLKPGKLKKHAKLARRLADQLGDAHDLAVLRECARDPDSELKVTSPALLQAIDDRSRRLRKKALLLGKQVYVASPARMDRQLERYWHRWHGRLH